MYVFSNVSLIQLRYLTDNSCSKRFVALTTLIRASLATVARLNFEAALLISTPPKIDASRMCAVHAENRHRVSLLVVRVIVVVEVYRCSYALW